MFFVYYFSISAWSSFFLLCVQLERTQPRPLFFFAEGVGLGSFLLFLAAATLRHTALHKKMVQNSKQRASICRVMEVLITH